VPIELGTLLNHLNVPRTGMVHRNTQLQAYDWKYLILKLSVNNFHWKFHEQEMWVSASSW
jgi:hypothetical protein